MPHTTHKDFIKDLKSAAKEELSKTSARFSSMVGFSLDDSQKFAHHLDNLDENAPDVVEKALLMIHEYLEKTGDLPYLVPVFEKLHQAGLAELPEATIEKLQELEFSPKTTVATEPLISRLEQFFQGLGYGKTTAQRYPGLANLLSTRGGQQQIVELDSSSKKLFYFQQHELLALFFANNIFTKDDLRPFTSSEPSQHFFVRHCLEHSHAGVIDKLFEELKVKGTTTSLDLFFPSFFHVFSNTKNFGAWYIDRASESELLELKKADNKTIVDCMKKMRQLSPENFSLTQHQLYAILKRDTTETLFFEEKGSPELLADEIQADDSWLDALITDEASSIHLSKILGDQIAREVGKIISKNQEAKRKDFCSIS